uniref:Uncharacterized protein n=1 Tax=Strongyloides stercoralis TaxID=6248 RepID=A0A0K0ET24_STRER
MNLEEKVFRISKVTQKILGFINDFEDYKNVEECCPLFKYHLQNLPCTLKVKEDNLCYLTLREITEENTIAIKINNNEEFRVNNLRKDPIKLKNILEHCSQIIIIYNYKIISSWYKKEAILTTNYILKNICKNITTIMFYFSQNNASEFWTYLLPMFNTLKLIKIGQFFSRYFSEKCQICQPRLFDFQNYKYLKFIDTSLLVHTEYYEEDTRMIKWLIKSLRNNSPITFVIRILSNSGNNNGMYEGNYKDLLSSAFAKEVVRNINDSPHYVHLELNTVSWDITSWLGRGNKKDFIYPPKRFKQICFKKIKYLTINLNNHYYFPNFSKYYSFTNYCFLECLTIVITEHFEEELTLGMLTKLLKTLKNVSSFKELTIINKNEFGQCYCEYIVQHLPLNIKKLVFDGYILYSNTILQSIITRCPSIEFLIMGKPTHEQSLPSLFLFSLTKLKYLSFWCFEEDVFHIPTTCMGIKIECHCSWLSEGTTEYTCIRKLLKCRFLKILQIVDQNNLLNGKFIYFNKTEDCLVLKNL